MTLPNKATFIGSATLFVLSVAAAPPLFATDIPLTNPSFESPALGDGGYNYTIPGWTITGPGVAGVWDPLVGQSGSPGGCADPSAAFVAGIPDGNQVGYSNGGDLAQTTGATITPGYRYTLKVSIGGRCPVYANQAYALILAGTAAVSTVTDSNGANSWVEQTVTYTSPPSDPNAGQPLAIKIVNYGGGQLDFDRVRLQAAGVLTCQGFLSPFDKTLSLKKKENRAIPVKMVLRDLFGNVITDAALSPPPVVQVTLGGVSVPFDDYNADLLPSGLSDDGNQFRYDPLGQQWIINLGTKQFTGSGAYTVQAIPGDDSYVIDSSCTQTFTRQ